MDIVRVIGTLFRRSCVYGDDALSPYACVVLSVSFAAVYSCVGLFAVLYADVELLDVSYGGVAFSVPFVAYACVGVLDALYGGVDTSVPFEAYACVDRRGAYSIERDR